MNPVEFQGANDVLQPHPNDVGKVNPLPIMRSEWGVTSVWQLTNEEFQQLMTNGGVIALHFASQTHAPVKLTVPDGGDKDLSSS